MRILILLLGVVMAGCAPQNGEPPNSAPSPQHAADTAVIRGTVAVVGSAPMNVVVLVQDANGESSRVEGPLREEIQRLAHAEVEVSGIRQPDPMYGSSIRATDYSVRSVNGEPVVTGIVERAADGGMQLRLEDGRTVGLAAGAEQLRLGQKVWIQGPVTVQVRTFGVIRP
jgi:hypothetical protein